MIISIKKGGETMQKKTISVKKVTLKKRVMMCGGRTTCCH